MRRLFQGLAISLAVGAAPVAAAETGLLLWGKLRVGMSRATVAALYPDAAVPLTQGCPAQLKPVYAFARLTEVVLHLDTRRGCVSAARDAMTRIYGRPASGSLTFVGAMSALNSDYDHWRGGPVLASLRVKRVGGAATLSFRIAPPATGGR